MTVRGKGVLNTYFLKLTSGSKRSAMSTTESGASAETEFGTSSNDKNKRLVDWNVEVLSGLLKKIVARRRSTGKEPGDLRASTMRACENSIMVLEEVQEIIALPPFDGSTIITQVDPDSIQLEKEVINELSILVTKVAAMYRQNPFHNFGTISLIRFAFKYCITQRT